MLADKYDSMIMKDRERVTEKQREDRKGRSRREMCTS